MTTIRYMSGVSVATGAMPRPNVMVSLVSIAGENGFSHGLIGLYKTAVAWVVLVLAFLCLPTYLFRLTPAILPLYFYMGIFLMTVPLILLKPVSFLGYLSSPFALWATLLIALNLIHYVSEVTGGQPLYAQLIFTRIQYILLAIAIGFVFFVTPGRQYRKIFPVLSVVISASVVLDFFFPGYLFGGAMMVFGRAAGAYFNPTVASEVILIGVLLALPQASLKWRTGLFVLAGLAIAATFTRSAFIAWLTLLLYLCAHRFLKKTLVVVPVLLMAGLLLAGGVERHLSNRAGFGDAAENLIDRVQFFSNPRASDSSAQDRLEVVRASWNLFVHNPVEGAGAGVTEAGPSSRWSNPSGPHNQLLMLAAEYGVFGVILWIVLLMVLWKGRYFKEKFLRNAMVLLFVFLTFFTHNMFDHLHWLLLFAMISIRNQNCSGRPKRYTWQVRDAIQRRRAIS